MSERTQASPTGLDWSAYETVAGGMGFGPEGFDMFGGPAVAPVAGGGLGQALALCVGKRVCQQPGPEVMCPSFRASGDPAHSTEGRALALRVALATEAADPAALLDPALARQMAECVACKGCKRECPNGVDMALLKVEYLARRQALTGMPLRSRLLAGTPRWLHHYRPLLRGAVALRNRLPWLAWLGERLFGISARVALPVPAARPFVPAPPVPGVRGTVLLLVDTFSRHYEPDIPQAAQRVLEAAGYRVELARPAPEAPEPERPLCCGRSWLAAGMVAEARQEARRMLAGLAPALAQGWPVVGLEPSCVLALRDDYRSLGLGPEGAALAGRVFMFEEFLARALEEGLQLPLRPLATDQAWLHGHCHQKAFGLMPATRRVLAQIPGLVVHGVESSCCGMAGSFGLEAEHAERSAAMAEAALWPALRQAPPRAAVVADGFSCRHQIRRGTDRAPRHVAQYLRDALIGHDS